MSAKELKQPVFATYSPEWRGTRHAAIIPGQPAQWFASKLQALDMVRKYNQNIARKSAQ